MREELRKENLRYLFAYGCWREGVDVYYERVCELLRLHGHDVRCFCLTIDPPGPRLSFNAMCHAWNSGDPALLKHLAKLEQSLEDRDVLINWHGINLPPQFVRFLPIHTVFVCNDDPESSYDLSRPAAWAYDQAFVGNVAAIDSYYDWGCTRVEFLPLGFAPWDIHPGLTEVNLYLGNRDIDVVFFGERESPYRQYRLDRLARAFPNAVFGGSGWPRGFIPKQEMLAVYARSKIGINLHNSTGPINQRLYQLPAHGVLQICDNKSNLPAVFESGKEIVGFETIGECIELVYYFLEHDAERREIALAGFRRAHSDYGILSVWKRVQDSIEKNLQEKGQRRNEHRHIAERRLRDMRAQRFLSNMERATSIPIRASKRILKVFLNKVDRTHANTSRYPKEDDYANVLKKYYKPPVERKTI